MKSPNPRPTKADEKQTRAPLDELKAEREKAVRGIGDIDARLLELDNQDQE